MRDLAELEKLKLVETLKEKYYVLIVTDEGRRYISIGLPEERLLNVLLKIPTITTEGVEINEVINKALEYGVELNRRELTIGLQHLIREKICRVEKGRIIITAKQDEINEFKKHVINIKNALYEIGKQKEFMVKDISKYSLLRKRKLIMVKERTVIMIKITSKGRTLLDKKLIEVRKIVTKLTPELIISGKWREVTLKEFDLTIEVPTIRPNRKHPYMEFLDEIREIMVSMGFEEVKGPHVELEFWNFDVLFQAQDHPAREVHDTFFLKYPAKGEIKDLEVVKRVKATHENGWITGSKGWRYTWSLDKALKLILRTQTTAVTIRAIYERGEGEYRCFTIDRVFRPETLDPKHAMEFYQLDGIMVGRNVNFKHLIGFFHEFAKRIGIKEVKVRPAYFPFTEPSVEGAIKHPKLGWMEVFAGGMFRPEVLYPLGVMKANVAAWAFGLDRIAMAVLGIDDIRDLFSHDIEFLRRKPLPLLTIRSW